MKNRRFRRNPATTAPPPAAAPSSPHAATAPMRHPDEHIYLPTTSEKLRAHAERCLGQIADAETQISELQDWIAHWRAEHADFLRAADLVERDRVACVLDATPRPGPAMGQDQLLNGWQPGFEAEDPRPPMQSTDPDTPHKWRATYTPDHGEPWSTQQAMTDGEIEKFAEEAGERAALTYQREDPWQDGRRHLTRFDVAWPDGGGYTTYERIDGPRLSQDGDTIPLRKIPAGVSR